MYFYYRRKTLPYKERHYYFVYCISYSIFNINVLQQHINGVKKMLSFLGLKFLFGNRTTVKKNYNSCLFYKIVGQITLLRILSVPRDLFYDALWTSNRNSFGKLYQSIFFNKQMIKSSLR